MLPAPPNHFRSFADFLTIVDSGCQEKSSGRNVAGCRTVLEGLGRSRQEEKAEAGELENMEQFATELKRRLDVKYSRDSSPETRDGAHNGVAAKGTVLPGK